MWAHIHIFCRIVAALMRCKSVRSMATIKPGLLAPHASDQGTAQGEESAAI